MNLPVNNVRLPLYVQIGELLTREINAGIWPDGSRLPTEVELSRKLNCAVGTLRKALSELEAKGILERIQGSGTYVRLNNTSKSIYSFFHLELNEGGGLPTAEILDLSDLECPADIPDLGEPAARRVFRIRRKRYLNGIPVALEEIWFDTRHKNPIEVSDISESLHHFYREKLGFWISNVEDRVSIDRFPDWNPDNNAWKAGQPCGFVSRISVANTGKPEEFSRTWFDTARAHYNARWR